MGECGCSSSELDVAFMKIKDMYLVVSIYPGCTECFPATGVNLRLENQKNYQPLIDMQHAFDLSELLNEEYDSFCFPVLDWSEIGDAIDHEKAEDIGEYHTFHDFWDDNKEWVREAAHSTLTKFIKERTDAADKTTD